MELELSIFQEQAAEGRSKQGLGAVQLTAQGAVCSPRQTGSISTSDASRLRCSCARRDATNVEYEWATTQACSGVETRDSLDSTHQVNLDTAESLMPEAARAIWW